jgi:hypothetical protein
MLSDFEDKSVCDSLNFESVENWGEGTLELDVNDGTNNLRNLSMSNLSAEATYMSGRSECWQVEHLRAAISLVNILIIIIIIQL